LIDFSQSLLGGPAGGDCLIKRTNRGLSSGKQPQSVKARSLLCYWAVTELEMSGADVAQKLKISNSAVSRSAVRGEIIAAELKFKFIEN
jgi:hypothetical protein